MATLVSVQGLVKHFPTKRRGVIVHAVNDVSLDILAGEAVGLVGESGSGKSTLGACLVKLLDPTQGRIYFEGHDITALSSRRFLPFRRRIQMVFQDPLDSLNPSMRVRQIIEEPLQLQMQWSQAQRRERVAELIDLVRLNRELAQRYPAQLSGGQQQRVGIARAIATNPSFIVLDEPTSALDVSVRAEIIDLLRQLQQRLQITYLFISHDLLTIRTICARIAVMYLGHIVELGSTEQIFNTPQHPYTRALLSSVLIPDPDAPRNPLLVKGEIPSPIDLLPGCPFASRCAYVERRCTESRPPLVTTGQGHSVACIKPLREPLGEVRGRDGEHQERGWASSSEPRITGGEV